MAKKVKRRQRGRQQKQGVNWLVMGGIIVVGALLLFGLMAAALRTPSVQALAEYCNEKPDRCVTQGAADAPVTIVEVSDFGCSHCRNFHEQTFAPLTQAYVETGQVRWITLPFALRAETLPATNAAMCANEQGAYFAYGEQLFAQQDTPLAFTQAGFVQAAEALSLEMTSFNQCLESGRYDNIVRANNQAANGVGVSGTPSFFINGRKLEGAHPFSTFQQHIDSALGS